MNDDLAGFELIIALAIYQARLSAFTYTLIGDDTVIDNEGREIFVDSRNNEWIIFPEDLSWEITCYFDKFEPTPRCTVRINDFKFSGDLQMYQHDMLITKLLHGERFPDLIAEQDY